MSFNHYNSPNILQNHDLNSQTPWAMTYPKRFVISHKSLQPIYFPQEIPVFFFLFCDYQAWLWIAQSAPSSNMEQFNVSEPRKERQGTKTIISRVALPELFSSSN